MLFSICSIYDSGISTWYPPIYLRNRGEALRMFIDEVNNSQSKLSKYPGDFTLFEIGSWDDAKCKFSLLDAPVSLGVATEYVKTFPAVHSGSGS